MDFNTTIDLIIRDLDEARKIIDDLKKYPGVPVLQIELAKAKCKSTAEVIALLKNFPGDIQYEEKENNLTAGPEKKETVVKKTSKTPQSEVVISNIPVKEKKDEETPVTRNETKSMADDRPHPSAAKNKPEQPPVKPSESTMVADTFSQVPPSFHEQLAAVKSDEDVSEILMSKPISSITEAIGLNDRFLFIREIFDGNQETYLKAIALLENAEDLNDAMALIKSYTGDNDENEAVVQLVNLVKRKYSANE